MRRGGSRQTSPSCPQLPDVDPAGASVGVKAPGARFRRCFFSHDDIVFDQDQFLTF
jgi:hypothetical protein